MSTAWGGQPPNLSAGTHWGAPGIGILGATMKAGWDVGEHGPSPLANDALADGSEYLFEVVTQPVGGTVDVDELGHVTITVPADGSYVWTYRLREDGVYASIDPIMVSVLVGAAANTGTAAGLGTVSHAGIGSVSGTVGDLADDPTAALPGFTLLAREDQVANVGGFEPKDPEEICTVAFDFARRTTAPSAPMVSVQRIETQDVDATPLALVGRAVVVGSKVLQRMRSGSNGSVYMLRCSVTAASGDRYVMAGMLAVKLKR